MKGDQRRGVYGQSLRNRRFPPLQRDRAFVQRQAVETGAVLRSEGLKAIERVFFLEDGCIAFEREGGVEDAGAAAGGFLALDRMGGAVGTEEEFGRAGGGGAADGETVGLALGDGEAIEVRADPAGEEGVAVDVEMVGRDRGGDVW